MDLKEATSPCGPSSQKWVIPSKGFMLLAVKIDAILSLEALGGTPTLQMGSLGS